MPDCLGLRDQASMPDAEQKMISSGREAHVLALLGPAFIPCATIDLSS